MIIGLCRIELYIPVSASLKSKRQVVKSVVARLRREFNISVAEVDLLDSRQYALIAVVAVSTEAGYLHRMLTRVIRWIEEHRLDCELVDYEIEMI